MPSLFEDTARRFINFVADSFMFFIGIIGVILGTIFTLSGEWIDELTTYKAMETFPWAHVIKVMLPPIIAAVGIYIKHRKMMANAINSPAPPPDDKATILQQTAPKKD